jgi:hypothetical protein
MTFGVTDCAATSAGNGEQASRASASDRERRGRARCQQSLILQSLQRRIDRADRVFSTRSFCEVATDGETVGFFAEAGDGEQGCELEGAE